MLKDTAQLTPNGADGASYEAITLEEQSVDVGMVRPWRIALIITGMELQLIFDLATSLTIGRADLTTGSTPDIDLGPFNAEDLGVSRRHCILQLDRDSVNVVDNKSLNGTFLNGKRLEAGKAYVVHHGDKLTVGLMEMQIELLVNPLD